MNIAFGSKAATRGNWNEVWAAFDRLKATKNASAANEDEAGGDMFSQAGVAAE